MNLFDINEISKKIDILEQKTMQEGFWNDVKSSSVVLQEIKNLKGKITNFNSINNEIKNLLELNNLLLIEEDTELSNELLKNTKNIEQILSKLEIETLLSRKIR